MDDWIQVLREALGSDRVGLDFETRPNGASEETTSALRAEEGAQIVGVALAWRIPGTQSDIKSAYVPIRHDVRFAGGRQPEARGVLRALSDFMDERAPGSLVVVANLSMELSMMLGEGVSWPRPGEIHDVQIAARVLNKGVGPKELIGLKPMQASILNKDMETKNDLDRWLAGHGFKPGKDIWHAPVAIAGAYAQDDAADALKIWLMWESQVYAPKSDPTPWWWTRAPNRMSRHDLYEMEVEVAIDCLIACLRGIRVDTGLTDRRANAAEILQEACTRWIRDRFNMPTLNPGSQTQLRGILFGSNEYAFKVTTAHLTDSFKKMSERDQLKIMATTKGQPVDYASLDVEALEYYAEEYPQHSDLMFMLAVYRKCNTAISWFRDRVLEYGQRPCPDPWWDIDRCPHEVGLVNLIFHRLRTVATVSGRKSSTDYNMQQVPKRFKMLIDSARVMDILAAFLPSNQMEQLKNAVDVVEVQAGDEAKALGLDAGSWAIDFSVRAMFIPREELNLRTFDLSQVEMRGFAHFSGNPMLCAGYGDPMSDQDVDLALSQVVGFMRDGSWGEVDWDRHHRLERNTFDIHSFVADQLGISRKKAKGVNFGIVYGMGKRKLAREQGWTPDVGAKYLKDYYSKLPEILQLQTKIKATLRSRGYIFDPFGRRYYLPMNRSYVGLNRLIQGWAASVFKVGVVRMCDVFESMGDRSVHPVTKRMMPTGPRLLTCVHDEAMVEVPKGSDTPEFDWTVRTCMTAVHGLRGPLGTSSERSSVSWDAVKAV
jgi:DNA polymerase I-like protein with 3'-5' exonuclease and polymerase domains